MDTKILAIGDDPDTLTALKAVARHTLTGCTLLTALNGPDGMELARAEDPDAILLDIAMPGPDALEVCRMLKADERLRDIPVVVLTAFKTDRESRMNALDAGAEAFLSKPLNEEELAAQIRVMARLKSASRAQRRESEQHLAELVADRTRAIELEVADRTRVEDALRASEERYRSLFDNMLNGFAYIRMIFDGDRPVDFEYLAANRAFETLSGLTGVVGKRVTEVIPGIREADPELFEIYGRVARTGVPERSETWVEALKAWYSISVYRSGLDHVVVVFDVITERKRAEEALRESEEQFRAMFQTASVGMAQADVRTGQWLRVNDRMCQITGYSAEELLTLRVSDITHPEDRSRDWDAFQRVVQGQAPEYRMEKRYVRKDGTAVWVNINMTVIRDAEGQPVRTVATIEDIAERKRAETQTSTLLAEVDASRKALLNVVEDEKRLQEALRHSERSYRRLFEANPHPMWIYDLETLRFLAVNDVAVSHYGFARDEFLAMTLQDIQLADDVPRLLDNVAHATAVPQESGTWRHRKKDGETIAVEISSHALDWMGRPARVQLAVDVTAREHARLQLRASEAALSRVNAELEQRVLDRTARLSAANQELDSFAYAVSHDLRAPLRAMSGFSLAILEDYGEHLPDEARDHLEHVQQASHNMGQLIDGLLVLSRSTRGELQRDRVDLSAMAKRLCEELARAEPARAVEWHVEAGLTPWGDARMLEAAMRNLLGNAWKYTAGRATPSVRVYAERDGGQLYYCVADNGVGFDMRHADRLFKPFQRLHRQEEFPGIGIGLATVQRVVHRHGGALSATAAVGQGATFRFHLPSSAELGVGGS